MESKKIYDLSLFIFRRDLRLFDNKALINASKYSKKIIPAFFLDERQINKSKNEYFSSNCVQFMLESLIDLNSQISSKQSKLLIYYGDLKYNIEKILSKSDKIGAIYLNQDYTPFSIKRDEEIKLICSKFKIDFHSYEDLMLTNLQEVKTPKGEFYKVYTPYCQHAMNLTVKNPDTYSVENFVKQKELKEILTTEEKDNTENSDLSKEIFEYSFEDLMEIAKITYNSNTEIKGGREQGYSIIKNINNFKDYGETRQYVKIPSTRFSAYLKFGCVSIREVYNAIQSNFGKNHELVKQLHWRDFFMKITYFYPHVIGNSFKPECDNIKWLAKEEHIEAWKKGTTGFPIVDAAMRCLNKTGYIHNKLRTMVCSFLVKDVLADWRIGEKYFANNLIDYDISLNNGGWQWTGSTGTDPRGEPRIYNPVMQSEKLDPDCEFILRWIPELKYVKKNHIHDWEKYNQLYEDLDYPSPMFSHYEQRDKAFKMFNDCKMFKNMNSNYKNKEKGYNNNFGKYNNYYENDKSKTRKFNGKNYSNKNTQNYYYEENEYNNESYYINQNFNNQKVNEENFYSEKPENQRNEMIIKMYENVLGNKKGDKTKKKNNASNEIYSMIYGGKNNVFNK